VNSNTSQITGKNCHRKIFEIFTKANKDCVQILIHVFLCLENFASLLNLTEKNYVNIVGGKNLHSDHLHSLSLKSQTDPF
jgi:hypothetical protein